MTRFMLLSVALVGLIAQGAVGDIVVDVENGDFELPVQTGAWVYYTTEVPGWTFSSDGWNGGGLYTNGANGLITYSGQGGFLGDLGTCYQTVTVPEAGTYSVSFYASGIAAATGANVNPLKLTLDETTLTFGGLTTVTPPQNALTWTATDPIELAAGDYVLKFAGTITSAASGIDNVTMTGVPVPEPGAFLLLATGLIALVCYAWKKRK